MTCYHLQVYYDFVTPKHPQPHIPLLSPPRKHSKVEGGMGEAVKGIKNKQTKKCTQRCKILC